MDTLAAFAMIFLCVGINFGIVLKTPLPPRGWNSYDSFSVPNETVALGALAAMKNLGMDKLGYEYLTLDAGWFGNSVRIDSFGRPIPDSVLFPSSAPTGNFKYLADKIRSEGFKFGIWYMGGIPAPTYNANTPIKGTNFHARDLAISTEVYCPRWDKEWGYAINYNHPAAEFWWNSLVELWSEWGISLIKLDCVNAQDETFSHRQDIIYLSRAFSLVESEFVFSLSPGGFANVSQIQEISPYVSMARVTDDFWDNWELYMNSGGGGGSNSGFSHWDSARDLVATVKSEPPTFWIDLDMIPFGRIGHDDSSCSPVGPGCNRNDKFSANEKQSIISLWTFVQSPFLYGGDLTDPNAAKTLSDFLFSEGILSAVSDISQAREALRVNNTLSEFIVWQGISKKSASSSYVSVFNLQNSVQSVRFPWTFLGLFIDCTKHKITDIWNSQQIPCDNSMVSVSLQPHTVLFMLIQ